MDQEVKEELVQIQCGCAFNKVSGHMLPCSEHSPKEGEYFAWVDLVNRRGWIPIHVEIIMGQVQVLNKVTPPKPEPPPILRQSTRWQKFEEWVRRNPFV